MTNETKPFQLETERLLIRPFCDEDIEAFIAYRNDPDVARWQGWSVPYPREKAMEFLEEMKNKDPEEAGSWLQIAIIVKETGEFIGDCAFFIKKDETRTAHLGCTIMQKYWRKGYAVEATRRLMAYLFDDLHLRRLIADTDVENTGSWKTLEKLGFRREAHFVENIFFKGHYASEYHYAMLEREWQALKSA
ncbi:MAG: N-acetyltransferase [Anaerolineaceae bacterium]|nr:MAG: N-acetyltransferase [Anaerolineaceae bacterium]